MNGQIEERRIRLVLFEKPGLLRASLSRRLASEPDLEVIGECGTSAEALALLNGSLADVVLLDSNACTEHADNPISAARHAGYQGSFLIVVGELDVRNLALALKLGASGIFLMSDRPEHLIQAIRVVANGDVWIDRTVVQSLAGQLIDRYGQRQRHRPDLALEERERTVVLDILGGLSNKQIAEHTGLSTGMVKNIVLRVFTKTGIRTRSQLVRLALEGSFGDLRDAGELPVIPSNMAVGQSPE